VVFDHPKLLSHLAIRYFHPSQTVDATATEGREVVRGSAQEVVAKREARRRWIDRGRHGGGGDDGRSGGGGKVGRTNGWE
jgi:hypothetical protein